MKQSKLVSRGRLWLGVALSVVFTGFFTRLVFNAPRSPESPQGIGKNQLAVSLGPSLRLNQFPEQVEVELPSGNVQANATYTIDPSLQVKMERLLARYRPDYSAFVALDARTGRVLVLASRSSVTSESENLALKASFPAASIFKIVTAAAALDQGVLTPQTVIPFDGANHTLYRRNVTQQRLGRWTRRMTLEEAFAKSVNTVFGKIGMFVLDPPQLREYAERFQFNKSISGDLPVEPGQMHFPADDPWGLAELASGFNRVSSMSPLQGALIAGAVANDGVMMEPFMVEGLTALTGEPLYLASPTPTSVTMRRQTAVQLRQMMRETVHSGTSRLAFRSLVRRPAFREVEIGGKTGSLRGLSPKGKCDWFVGYVRAAQTRVAIAALTVNEDKWRVRSSHLARVFVEEYLDARR